MIARELRHFLLLTQLRHYGRAALALRLTQPALSKSIRRLEENYGARLLIRGRSGVTLTQAGEALLRHAKLADRELSLARDELDSVRAGNQGEVVVGVAISLAHRFLPTASVRFCARHPNARIRVVTGLNDTLVRDLISGDVDVVVSAYTGPGQQDQLVYEDLFTDEATAVVRAGHPVLKNRRLSMKTLLRYPWVLYGNNVLSTQYLKAAFITAGLTPPSPVIESNSADYNKSLLAMSDFVGYLPYEVYRTEYQEKKLARVPLGSLAWERRIGLIYRRGGSLPHAASALIGEMRTLAGQIRDAKQEWTYGLTGSLRRPGNRLPND